MKNKQTINTYDAIIDKAKQLANKMEDRQKESIKIVVPIAEALAKEGHDQSVIWNVIHEMGYSTYGAIDEITKAIDKHSKGKKRVHSGRPTATK